MSQLLTRVRRLIEYWETYSMFESCVPYLLFWWNIGEPSSKAKYNKFSDTKVFEY